MSDLTDGSLVAAAGVDNAYIGQNNNHERCLKSLSKTLKRKCHKSLKKKLKKYKIRKNGEEDPDVLDVSKSFLSSLIIKSPGSSKSSDCKSDLGEHLPPNYLFKKMGKRRTCNMLTESNREGQMKPDILSLLPSDSHDKTHTNAFKLMMDSRHKSIGCNSPGKDIPRTIESQEIIEKKEIKAKRTLSLQKMAESKGSIKKQELEECRERYVNKQMLKRAERLKAMLTQDNAEVTGSSKDNSNVTEPSSKSEDKLNCEINIEKTLQLCNIFDPTNRKTNFKNQKQEKICSDDEEFLNKLSPSIRKKENMTSYFKKIPKSTEEENIVLSDDSSQNIIKVKFTPKRKKKIVKKKCVLQNLLSDSNEPHSQKDVSLQDLTRTNTKYENYQKHPLDNTLEALEINKCGIKDGETRPKRIPKRPAKYTENIEIFTSDEELHIITPKKKKNLGTNNCLKTEANRPERTDSVQDKKLKQNIVEKVKKSGEIIKHKNKANKMDSLKETGSLKRQIKLKNVVKSSGNPVKLAPIFLSKQSLTINSAEKDAKQIFLQSGVPEKLKKSSSQEQSISATDIFHSVVHVQQATTQLASSSAISFKNIIFDELNSHEISYTFDNTLYKSLLSLNKKETSEISFTKGSKDQLLQSFKKSYQKFPVYRTYYLLKGKSKGEFRDYNYPDLDNSIEIVNGLQSNENNYIEKLCWVDKYKPNSTKQIIGNFTAIEELKKWLQSWTENLVKTKSGSCSEGSDFSDFADSDTDSRDTIRNSNSVIIISGDVGSGKTSSVYAVAAELAIKVIEVNASSKRTGKKMLQDLQEATRSHKVDRGKSGLECSQIIPEILKLKEKLKKRGRPKKIKQVVTKNSISTSQKSELSETPSSQESARTDMSLILIDDADIVFDQDDGFCSAVSQLIQSSKRPVILVTSSLSCPHLQKFVQYGKIIHMHRFLPRMLGLWLDIMCLADIGTCCSGLGNKLLEHCKGDIRKTINLMQFYMASYKHITNCEKSAVSEDVQSQELDKINLNIDDECSSTSWIESKNVQENIEASVSLISDVSKTIIQEHINIMLNNLPLNLLSLWWSLPKILDYDDKLKREDLRQKKSSSEQLFTLSNMLNIVSEADYFSGNIAEGIPNKLWCSKEPASVIESESLDYYDYSKEVSSEIASELAMRGLNYSHKKLECETCLDISLPGYTVEREREKIVDRHHTLTNYLNPGVVLDRKALALDYWSSCRTICRLEMNKTDINVKRNNRFCHYLKSLNVLCKNDYFDALSKSLNSFNDTGKL